MFSQKILLVEDDRNLAFVIKDNLEVNGFNCSHANNGVEALKVFGQEHFDLCIMDVMMPEMDGFECARQMRSKNREIPILFLSARTVQEDVIKGFNSGGDDYIAKPFNFNELLMRIKVFLRRSSTILTESKTCQLSANTLFDYDNLELIYDQNQRKLTHREAELLYYFYLNINTLVKREEILINVWGDDDYFLGRSLDVFISRLRKYLSVDSSIEIQNHHGVGFVFKVRS